MTVHRCPTCALKGHYHGFNLSVFAHVSAIVQQTFPTAYTKVVKTYVPAPSDEPTWSGESQMECRDCGHLAKAVDFTTEYFRAIQTPYA